MGKKEKSLFATIVFVVWLGLSYIKDSIDEVMGIINSEEEEEEEEEKNDFRGSA